MPHIECVKNNGKPYLRIAESRYVKDIGRQKKFVIKNLGPLSKFDDGKPDFLKRFREKFKNGEIDFDGITYYSNLPTKRTFEIDNDMNYIDLKNIGFLFLQSVYNSLGISQLLNQIKSDSKIEYDLNGLTKLLVFGRILNPQSKKKTFEERDKYLFSIVSSNEIKEVYRTLDVLDKNSKKIQNRMNTKIKNSSIGRVTNLTYYDVTNYYFETMYGDDDIYELDENNEIVKGEDGKPIIVKKGFRKKGVSKENSKGPIVQMGLFIDNNGIPVSHKLFPGNTQDKTTFKNVLEKDVDEMDLGRIVVVADNGMNTQENKYLITEKGNGYIVSKSVKKSWTKIGPWALEDKDYTEIKNSSGEVVFKYKSRINEIELTYKNEDGTKSKKIGKEKEIIYWSKKHYEKELHQNKKFIEYLESCKDNPDKLKDKQRKSQEFIEVLDIDKKTGEVIKTQKVVVFLEEKLKKYKETLGFYSIVTSEIDEDDKEIINRYHGLSRIEDSFRIIKSDLEGRPIYVWTEEHIKAHFLICFIALTIIRIIQFKILKHKNKSTLNVDGWEQGITADKIKQALNNFKACSDKNGTCLISTPENEIEQIIKSIGLEMPNLTTIDKIDKFKNTLNKGIFM
ncbi:MAG: IS1634 family transposase [Mollicutes bacterium]|nr:IS1634 family transposase [Mollicutes bacterium]